MTYFNFDKAVELVAKLNAGDSDGWTYVVCLWAGGGLAKIAVFDEESVLLGYL